MISYKNNIDDFEKFFDKCVSLNADDILENEDTFEVLTSLDSHNTIIIELEKKYNLANFSSIEWRPLNLINITDEQDAKNLIKLLEKLEDLDDVQSVSANFNISDDLMEKVFEE